MNVLHKSIGAALPILVDELVAHTPATLSELVGAIRQRGFRLNEIEMAAAVGA